MNETAASLGPLPSLLPRRRRIVRRRAERGQVAVEAAIVLPAMTFLILTMLQLTMVQHARIMTEYAAYTAARTGIVMNANVEAMERAAAIALSPTYARTDERASLDRAIETILPRESAERMSYGTRLVRVQVLNPTLADFGAIARHLNHEEIDFDDIRPAAARANQLQIRVRYMYRMSIPFANSILQNIWLASRLRVLDQWTGMLFTNPEMGGRSAQIATRERGSAALAEVQDGQAILAAGAVGRYYFPLQATYTMRMQSNPYRRNMQ